MRAKKARVFTVVMMMMAAEAAIIHVVATAAELSFFSQGTTSI